jgi:hypothetical protein
MEKKIYLVPAGNRSPKRRKRNVTGRNKRGGGIRKRRQRGQKKLFSNKYDG